MSLVRLSNNRSFEEDSCASDFLRNCPSRSGTGQGRWGRAGKEDKQKVRNEAVCREQGQPDLALTLRVSDLSCANPRQESGALYMPVLHSHSLRIGLGDPLWRQARGWEPGTDICPTLGEDTALSMELGSEPSQRSSSIYYVSHS